MYTPNDVALRWGSSKDTIPIGGLPIAAWNEFVDAYRKLINEQIAKLDTMLIAAVNNGQCNVSMNEPAHEISIRLGYVNDDAARCMQNILSCNHMALYLSDIFASNNVIRMGQWFVTLSGAGVVLTSTLPQARHHDFYTARPMALAPKEVPLMVRFVKMGRHAREFIDLEFPAIQVQSVDGTWHWRDAFTQVAVLHSTASWRFMTVQELSHLPSSKIKSDADIVSTTTPKRDPSTPDPWNPHAK